MSQPDVDAMAAEVVLLIKSALAPLQEKIAVLEARLTANGIGATKEFWAGLEETVVAMRERLAVVEIKAAPTPFEPDAVLAPVLARALAPVLAVQAAQQATMASLEARWGDIGPLRERVAVIETKAAQMPEVTREAAPEVDLAPFLARLDAVEARSVPLDGKDGAQGPPGEAIVGPKGDTGDRGPEGPAGPARDGRDGVPGVPGMPGEKGIDGLNGKDGADGLGFDDFEELFDGERTFTRRYVQGDRVKEFVFKTAIELYRGVWVEGKSYERGDRVTWGGSEWHCNEDTTSKPGDGSKAWTLTVKKGRDGRDGLDAPGALPVVRTR